MAVVRVTPSGVMDKDTDLAYVNQGNYVDANDIRHRQTDGNTFGGVMSVMGNTSMLQFPDYTSVNKKFRIFLDLTDFYDTAVGSVNFTWKLQEDGSAFIGTANNTATFIASLSVFANTVYTTIDGLVGYTTVGAFAFTATKTVGGVVYAGYFDMEFTGNTVDYKLWVENTVSNAATIYVTREWVPSAADQTFKVVGSQQLDEKLFVFLASVTKSSGIISLLSEIGVVYSTDNGVTYTYNRLIRSKQLGFSTDRRIEASLEQNGSIIDFYWTDGNAKPRVMYLTSSLFATPDAFLVAAGGRYDLETIDEESSFFYKVPSAYFDNIQVIEGGGNITAGNKRYTGRFLTQDFVPTDFLYPTNPINIYNASFALGSKISGNLSNVLTDKSVFLKLKNITPGIYKYFELVAVEYLDETFVATIIQRFNLGDGQVELDVKHTNIGQENIALGNNELLALTSKYLSVQTMKIFDNRMTISNMTEQLDYNLDTWAQSIKHSLETKYIDSLGYSSQETTDYTKSLPDYSFGEYQDPMNVLENVGYMFNDTYRFGIQVKWKDTGKWSSPYWLDDIRFDNATNNVVGTRRNVYGGSVSAVNIGTETITVNAHNFYEGQKIIFSATTIGGVTANTVYYAKSVTTNTFKLSLDNINIVNLTSSGTGTVLNLGLDLNTTYVDPITGDLKVSVYYVKFTNIDLNYSFSSVPLYNLIEGYRITRAERIPEVLVTGMFISSCKTTSISTKVYPWFQNYTGLGAPAAYPNASVLKASGGSESYALNSQPSNMYFFSPDLYFNQIQYNFSSNLDKIKVLGRPQEINLTSGVANATTYESVFVEYDGSYKTAYVNSYASFNIDDAHVLERDNVKIVGGITMSANIDNITNNISCINSIGLKTSVPVFGNIPAGMRDNAVYYGQIFRDLGANKKYYANKELTIYQSTGTEFYINRGTTGTLIQDVFGGDVFNQRSILNLRNGKYNPTTNVGGGYGISFYSQNSVNTQMQVIPETTGAPDDYGYQFPQYVANASGAATIRTYLQNMVVVAGSASPAVGTWGLGLMNYLGQWPEVSKQNVRNKSYDLKDGTIVESGYDSTSTYNGSIPTRIAWSAKKVIGSQKDNYRLFKPLDFADLDSTLGAIVHHEIVDNNFYTWQPYSVQRQYFRDASLIGAQEGTDVVVGSGSILGSRGQELTTIGMSKKWSHAKGKTPTGKETFYWYNDQLQKFVRFGQDGTRVISDKGMISYLTNNGKYVSNQDYPLTGLGVHGVWNDKYAEAIFTFKYNDGASNKQFTVVYDEIKNGFVAFHSYYPNIYLKFKNTFFSPNPALPKALYLHDRGSESTYYGSYATPSITGVMNYEPNISKNFEALQFVTDTQPFDVYLTTTNHVSYLDETEFEKREDLWYSPIKNDSTSTGLNNGNTSRLWGKWLKVKMTFEASSGKQKLINFIVKFRAMTRLYNQ